MNIIQAHSIEQAKVLLNKNSDAYILSGGTDIFVERTAINNKYRLLIDISPMTELKQISICSKEAFIGAAATFTQLEQITLPKGLECLTQAAGLVGGPQIRNRGTIGGNIQTASPAGDICCALLALDASVHLESVEGDRWIPLSSYFSGVKQTVKKQNEIITQIRIPVYSQARSVFLKQGQRNSLAISIANLAMLRYSNGYRVSVGSVGPTPILAKETIRILNNPSSDVEMKLITAKRMLASEIAPITDVRASRSYRMKVVLQLLEDSFRHLNQQEEH